MSDGVETLIEVEDDPLSEFYVLRLGSLALVVVEIWSEGPSRGAIFEFEGNICMNKVVESGLITL